MKRFTKYRVIGYGPSLGRPWEIERLIGGRWTPSMTGPFATREEAVAEIERTWHAVDAFLAEKAAQRRRWWKRLFSLATEGKPS